MFGSIIWPSAVTLGYLLASIPALLAAWYGIVRTHRIWRMRRLGGRRAFNVTPNLVSIWRVFSKLAQAQAEDRLYGYYVWLFNKPPPGSQSIVEFEIPPFNRFFLTRDPDHIKTILTSKFTDFGKGPIFHRMWKPFLGDGIFNTDGKLWHGSRSLIRPMFMKDRVSDLAKFERGVQAFMAQLPGSGQTVELMGLLYRATLDITTEFLLGHSAGSLENPELDFIKAFDEVQKTQMRIAIMYPFDVFIGRKEYYSGIKTLEAFIMPFVEKTLTLTTEELEEIGKLDQDFTFLHGLASFTREPNVIRDQIMNVLLAGRDTTAGTLSWAFYELAAYPEKWARLREEVLSTVGSHKAPTYDDLKNLRYLRYTLNETLRLYPAVPYNSRTALQDTTLAGGPGKPDIAILKGDAVAYSPYLMQRRRELYPPVTAEFADPLIFSPERWYNWQPKAWEFVPFNGGPRICVGQNFAMTEMAYFMVRILQRYERLEYRGDWAAQLHKADIVARPSLGVPVALFEAGEGGGGHA
ncbi:cytochrome P450 [Apiospora rasikravindrae]|uniref:Cytochrome P450 n=1 Tax=Apiospora rasikravindrae TaxID=990691 RepID=A0ABR1SXS7_9PEZI